jgi:parallel beta-helix repeat protein
MNKMRTLLLILITLLAVGCAVSSKDTMVITQPVSSVKSAIDSSPADKEAPEIDADKLPNFIAIVPFDNLTEEPEASIVLRRTLQNHLSSKNFQVLHWREVDQRLVGLEAPLVANDQRLSAALGVDGLLRGKITSYELFYAGIYAHIKLGMDLSLESSTGESLWSDQLEVTTRAGGMSTSAWGLLLNAALAAMHLNQKNLLVAADQLGREVAQRLPEPAGYQGEAGPVIEEVIHDGANKVLTYGDTLTVGIKGEAGQRASVNIAGVGSFDLAEVEPGTYIARIPISTTWNVIGKEVSGRLTSKSGGVTSWVSPVGLIVIDNQAPGQVAQATMEAHSGNAYLSWQAPPETDVSGYRVYSLMGSERVQLAQTEQTTYTIEGVSAFNSLRYEITALDRNGNESIGAVVSGKSYPVPGAAAAEVASSKLGGVVDTGLMLSRANSPYLLTENLLIARTGALFVEPGTVIQVGSKGSITIRGESYFWGGGGPIRFEPRRESDSPAQYLILDSDKTIELEGVRFERGGVALEILQGSPNLKALEFVGSTYSALAISGSASPSIVECTINGSNTSGVVIENHARPIFRNCSFENNQPFHIQSTSIYEVKAIGNTWVPAASPTTILGQVRYQ